MRCSMIRPDPGERSGALHRCRERLRRHQGGARRAKYILMERFAEDASLLSSLRGFLKDNATLSARVIAARKPTAPNSATTSSMTKRLKAPHRTAPWRSSAGATRASSMPASRSAKSFPAPAPLRGDDRRAFRHRQSGPRRRQMAGRSGGAGPGRSSSTPTWKPICSASCAKVPRTRRLACSDRNLHDLLLPPPPARARPWGSTRACSTGCKVAVVDAPASCSTPPPSTRTHRATTGRHPQRAGQAVRQAWRRPDRHRQRHRQPRDRQVAIELIKKYPA